MLFNELRMLLQEQRERVAVLESHLNIEKLRTELAEYETKTTGAGFWDNPQAAQKVIGELNDRKDWVESWEELSKAVADLTDYLDLAEESDDVSVLDEIEKEVRVLMGKLDELELRNMLRSPDDERNAILAIHSGAGGTEAQDWAEMLLRMYTRWCERKGYKVSMADLQDGEGAGIKSASVEVIGKYAYGYLKAENGVHRLVRISPFDANARRHTSFASVFVYPEIEDDVAIEISPSDLKVDTFRSGGKGGQNVNKVETAVRITHLPSGVIVACQQERSQFQNKERAMKMLRSRLYQIRKEEEEARLATIESGKKRIEWGSQIRSYVFQPYQLVKDHRTGTEMGDVQAVMDGEIDRFITSYLSDEQVRNRPHA